MRITHVITRLITGGAQENTVSSVLGLRKFPGLEVDLVSGPSVGAEGSLEPMLDGVPGILTLLPDLVRPVHPWRDARCYFSLVRLFKDRQPDIVHTHSGKAGVLGRLAAARAGVRVIVHTIHGPSFGAFQGPIPNLIFRNMEVLAGRKTTHFVVVADAMKTLYLNAGIGSPAQYTRIFSGFDLEPFLTAKNDLRLRQRLGLMPEDFVVGKIARLFKLKGHDDLLDAAPGLVAASPRIKFLLVGDGRWRERLEARARALNLAGRFVFTGLVPPAEVASYVGIMDVLVHLSRREGLARALPQALAAGKPVIAYDCDGAGEVCVENETGFLLRPGDLAALKLRLTELAAAPAMRDQLGERGRRMVRERFGVEQMVNELQQLYVRLC
jgi:glycosyltransferase involved in cell wall biosynthesis